MRALFLSVLVLMAVPAVGQDPAGELSQLEWLCHTWERVNVKPGRKAYESWVRASDDALTGIGVTLQGKDTVFKEKLKILHKEGSWYYVADVAHNAAPVYFKITFLGDSTFTCTNPDHDFPKKIEYTLKGEELTAHTSGDGKTIDFLFKLTMK